MSNVTSTPSAAGAVDRRHEAFRLAGCLGVRAVVGDVHRRAAPPADLHRLLDATVGVSAAGAAIPQLDHVARAGVAHHARQRDKLVGVAPRAGVVVEAARQTDRAVVETLPQGARGRRQRVAGQRCIAKSNGLEPEGSVRDEVGRR